MTLQIVGAGVGRTGTHSLKIALEQLLGGTCHHMIEVFTRPDHVESFTGAINGQPTDWPRSTTVSRRWSISLAHYFGVRPRRA